MLLHLCNQRLLQISCTFLRHSSCTWSHPALKCQADICMTTTPHLQPRTSNPAGMSNKPIQLMRQRSWSICLPHIRYKPAVPCPPYTFQLGTSGRGLLTRTTPILGCRCTPTHQWIALGRSTPLDSSDMNRHCFQCSRTNIRRQNRLSR